MVSDRDKSVDEETKPRAVASVSGAAGRAQGRKVVLLALLLFVLALLVYLAYTLSIEPVIPAAPSPEAAATVSTPEYLFSIEGPSGDPLVSPIGVDVGSNGRVYVVDLGDATVKAFSTDGKYLFSFNSVRSVSWESIFDGASKRLIDPVYLAVDGDNNVWVTDRGPKAVYVFDANGKFKRVFTPSDNMIDEMSPLGIDSDGADGIYVTNVANLETHGALVFDTAGRLKEKIGKGGRVSSVDADPGSFYFPNGIAVSPPEAKDRKIAVADSNNGRVQVFDMSGSLVKVIPTLGTPRGVAIDARGDLFVADVLAHYADVYSLDTGKRLAKFGGNGAGPGQFQYPEDVALDSKGRIYVSDRENGRIQVWHLAESASPTRPIEVVKESWPWCLSLLPLLLILLLPLFLRRRRFVATEDFVEAMAAAELVDRMPGGRRRWIVTEDAHAAFEGRTVDGVDLGSMLAATPYSYPDATAIMDDLGIPLEQAAVLALAQRDRVLCTEDAELARLAAKIGVDVYDRAAFVERYVAGERE